MTIAILPGLEAEEAALSKETEHKPHYLGHRQRLRARFLETNGVGLADYELLEMLLFAAIPRADTKPLAKRLLAHFGSFSGVIQAEITSLRQVEGVGDGIIAALKVVDVGAQRLLLSQMDRQPLLSNWQALLDYCKVTMAEEKIEQFRILFLNKKNGLIRNEIQQRGTVDHAPVYVREVVKRALELGASALILVHNHPSGDPTPSKPDIDITQQIIQASKPLGVKVHDHLIISRGGHYSFKSHGLI